MAKTTAKKTVRKNRVRPSLALATAGALGSSAPLSLHVYPSVIQVVDGSDAFALITSPRNDPDALARFALLLARTLGLPLCVAGVVPLRKVAVE